MEKAKRKYASIFELDGIPQMSKALPLALQHVVAMIVGCVTPAIIVAGVAGLDNANRVMLIQSALIVSALSTFLQLFPIGKKGGFRLGSGLPVIMGVSFAYVASMQAIAADSGIAAIFGAQIVGGIIAVIIGFFIDKIRKVFPPLVTGTVVFTIGLSLYPTAVNYMAGGASSANYGHWANWLVAFITLAIVTFLNHFTKGFVKLASILIGIICGYIIAACFGMVNLTAVAQASFFQAPQIMHFGIKFEPSSCIAIGLLLIWISPTEWLIVPGCILVGLGYGIIQPLIYDKTVDTAIPQKTTLALAFVMVMNYLAILLSPFITDFFQWIFHTGSQEFPFIFKLCITILIMYWAYAKKEEFLFSD